MRKLAHHILEERGRLYRLDPDRDAFFRSGNDKKGAGKDVRSKAVLEQAELSRSTEVGRNRPTVISWKRVSIDLRR